MADPYLQRMHMDMDTWLVLERILCSCTDVCRCGWDDMDEDDDRSA